MITIAITVVVAIVLLMWLSTCIVITEQEHTRIIETFGKFSSVRTSGLGFKWPAPIQTASENFSLQITQITEDVSAKSSDKAFVTVPVNVQIRVDENNAELAYYKLSNPDESIRSYVKNRVRGKASSMTFDELFSAQTDFQDDVFESLTERMASFGFIIENVLVDDPQPSESLRESFDRVLASERLKEAAVNEGEAARLLSVARANAEGEALEIKGKAWSEFRKTIAEGNAEALDQFAGKTGLTPAEGLTFFTSINEMEAVRDAAQAGGQVVFVTGSAKPLTTDPALLGVTAGARKDGGVIEAAPCADDKPKTESEKAEAETA